MKIEGSYRGLKGSLEIIYHSLMDPKILRKCIPGCKELYELELDQYECNLTWGYSGTVRAERTAPPCRVKLIVEGKGPMGSVKATGDVELESKGEEAILVKYTGDFFLGGPAAILQMGSLMAGGLPYRKLINSFFDNFKAELATTTLA